MLIAHQNAGAFLSRFVRIAPRAFLSNASSVEIKASTEEKFSIFPAYMGSGFTRRLINKYVFYLRDNITFNTSICNVLKNYDVTAGTVLCNRRDGSSGNFLFKPVSKVPKRTVPLAICWHHIPSPSISIKISELDKMPEFLQS